MAVRRRLLNTLGGFIRRHRDAQDLSQELLAEIAGIDRNYVGLIERGERSPSLDLTQKVAAALGLRLATLLAEMEDHCPPDPRILERRRKLMRPRKRRPPG
jgi:transcriptional regulator with XRE-family HTH domain